MMKVAVRLRTLFVFVVATLLPLAVLCFSRLHAFRGESFASIVCKDVVQAIHVQVDGPENDLESGVSLLLRMCRFAVEPECGGRLTNVSDLIVVERKSGRRSQNDPDLMDSFLRDFLPGRNAHLIVLVLLFFVFCRKHVAVFVLLSGLLAFPILKTLLDTFFKHGDRHVEHVFHLAVVAILFIAFRFNRLWKPRVLVIVFLAKVSIDYFRTAPKDARTPLPMYLSTLFAYLSKPNHIGEYVCILVFIVVLAIFSRFQLFSKRYATALVLSGPVAVFASIALYVSCHEGDKGYIMQYVALIVCLGLIVISSSAVLSLVHSRSDPFGALPGRFSSGVMVLCLAIVSLILVVLHAFCLFGVVLALLAIQSLNPKEVLTFNQAAKWFQRRFFYTVSLSEVQFWFGVCAVAGSLLCIVGAYEAFGVLFESGVTYIRRFAVSVFSNDEESGKMRAFSFCFIYFVWSMSCLPWSVSLASGESSVFGGVALALYALFCVFFFAVVKEKVSRVVNSPRMDLDAVTDRKGTPSYSSNAGMATYVKMPTFKLILIGDSGVGKTTFVKRHLTGEFEKKHVPTLGVEVHPLRFLTNYGPILFNIWDCAGEERCTSLRSGYYNGAECCIIMFDLTDERSFKNVSKWKRRLRRVCKDIPIVISGNKCDVHARTIKPQETKVCRAIDGVMYFDISAKSNYNFEKPFLWLARKLQDDTTLIFVEALALRPSEVTIDPELIRQYDREMAAACARVLRDFADEDDEFLSHSRTI